MIAIAAETSWPEERILLMPLTRVFQYQHCLLRRNGVRACWTSSGEVQISLREQLEALRGRWDGSNDPDMLSDALDYQAFVLTAGKKAGNLRSGQCPMQ